ncbi:hypothetical protein A9W95_17755 [Mycobacterium sp. 1423905.2]|nr:hypothetical protein A9W95_17755 [Mycobacterium sp. 1423905.2]
MSGRTFGVDRLRLAGPYPQHRSLAFAEDFDIGGHSAEDSLRGDGEQDGGQHRAEDEEHCADSQTEAALSLVCLHAKHLVSLRFQEQHRAAFCRPVVVSFEHGFEYA